MRMANDNSCLWINRAIVWTEEIVARPLKQNPKICLLKRRKKKK